MIENSPIRNKIISSSIDKLQKATSQTKFRLKSLRIKTTSNQIEMHIQQKLGLPFIHNQSQKNIKNHQDFKSSTNSSPTKNIIMVQSNVCSTNIIRELKSHKIIEKNYQKQFNKMNVESQFLRNVYELKSEESETKQSEYKFQMFLKNLYLKLVNCKGLRLNSLNFGGKTMNIFLNWYMGWSNRIIQIDMSYCIFEKESSSESSSIKFIERIIEKCKKVVKLQLCNMSLNSNNFKLIFEKINLHKAIFSLNISNLNSQNLNRFGEDLQPLEKLVKDNTSICILKMNNLQLKKEGLDLICKGLLMKKHNPLKILSLASNFITHRAMSNINAIVKSGLTHLDLSENPLGQQFYTGLTFWKNCSIKQFNLSSTNMTSLGLIHFLENIIESKSITTFKANNNDFSHHWFAKIKDCLESNSSLEVISFVDCNIKILTPVFEGLTYHKYMKKINLSNNTLNLEEENIQKICECLQINKELIQIKIRFCGYKENQLIPMIQALENNRKLATFDISQNLIAENGGIAILKLLEENSHIENIVIEKIQIPERIRCEVEQKLKENKSIRFKQNIGKLKEQTVAAKAKDSYTWEDLNQYQAESDQFIEKIENLQIKVKKMENIALLHREAINTYIKTKKDQEKQLDNIYKEKARILNQKTVKAEKQLNKLIKSQQKLKNEAEVQEKMITFLQQRIKKENQHIRKRQNELEEMYRNQKYLNKRGSKTVEKNQKVAFDPTSSIILNSKKKSEVLKVQIK